MTFYFLNSYQQSPVGFQLSRLAPGADRLEPCSHKELPFEEFQSLMTSSGTSCAIGSVEDTIYLVLHSLSFTDAESRQWYVTLGITADKGSREPFTGLVRKLFLDYTGFLGHLQNWFRATPEEPLSYAIDTEALQRWLDAPVPEIGPFHQTAHPVVDQLRAMLEKAEKGIHRRLFLLVPESTVSYFFIQNSVFDGELPYFLFNAEEFYQLLLKEAALLKEEEPSQQQKAAPPLWEQLGLTKEQFLRYVATGVIACAGFFAMVSHFVRKNRIPTSIRRFKS